MKSKPFIALTLPYILAILTCCNGQNPQQSHAQQTSVEKKSLGNQVTQLASDAMVIYRDKQNNLWFGSKAKGLYKYDGKKLVLFTTNDGVCGYHTLSVQEDNQGNLYFDTPKGICKYNGKKFTRLKVTKDNKNEWKLTQNDLWFRMGWEHSGPFRYDGKNLYQLTFPKNDQEVAFRKINPNLSFNPYGIYSLYKDTKGNIWMGTSSLGIYMFDGKSIYWMYEKQLTETPSGGAFGIRSIAEDKAGNYWICNANYKYELLSNAGKSTTLKLLSYKRQTGIPNNRELYFLSISTDSKGELWMQTYGDGLWRNNGKGLAQVFIKVNNVNISPTAMYQDKQGVLWFGTEKQGIFKYNGKAFEKFEIK